MATTLICFNEHNQQQSKRKRDEEEAFLPSTFLNECTHYYKQEKKKRKLKRIVDAYHRLNNLPDEMFYMEIFAFLQFEDLAKCAMVCKQWFNVVGKTKTTIHHSVIIEMLKNNTKFYCAFVASACRHFTNIHELSLYNCGMINMFNNRENGYLETVMGNLNNIRKLEINGLRITDYACQEFSKSPKPFLTELRLDHCMIGDSGFSALSRNNVLENVSILSMTSGAIESCQELSMLKNLKYLDFSNNCINKEGARYLSNSMANVECLDLSYNNIEDGFEFLCGSTNNNNLTKLTIAGNNVPGSACKNIAHLKKLTFLDISSNPLGHEGASFIAKGLENITTLKLSDAKINSAAMVYLSEGVMNQLTDLSIEGNFFGDEGCLVFRSAMFSKLNKLKLNRNCITCFGCEHLACENLKNVEELNLAFNRIKGRGVNFLSEAKFENLKSLNMSSNYIPQQGVRLFTKRVFSKLEVLFMMGNRSQSLDLLTTKLPNLRLRDF